MRHVFGDGEKQIFTKTFCSFLALNSRHKQGALFRTRDYKLAAEVSVDTSDTKLIQVLGERHSFMRSAAANETNSNSVYTSASALVVITFLKNMLGSTSSTNRVENCHSSVCQALCTRRTQSHSEFFVAPAYMSELLRP